MKRFHLMKRITILFSMVALFSVLYLSLNDQPEPVEAACGVSTSSCLTCHEELGKNPVNTQGDWHTQHQFGDFCQACHQGDANSDDSTVAHTGIVKNPLDTPDQNCQSCHSADFEAKAALYKGGSGTQTALPGNAAKATGPNGASDAPPVQSKLGNGILIAFNLVALIVLIVLFRKWQGLKKLD